MNKSLTLPQLEANSEDLFNKMDVSTKLSKLLEPRKLKPSKKTLPQKYFIKVICDWLYIFGAGIVWYENRERTKKQNILYYIWVIISNTYMFGGVANELIANFRSDLTKKEQSDLMQFTLAHTTVSSKIIGLYLLKSRIKILFVKFFHDFYRDEDLIKLEKKSVTVAIRYCLVVCLSVYFTLLFAIIDGFATYLKEGVPIRTEVTYYPFDTSPRIQFNVLRFLIEIHWYYLVTVMLLVDCLCISSLVFIDFKFKNIQHHFRKIREKLLQNYEKKSVDMLRKEYETEFTVGIRMHKHALWYPNVTLLKIPCARNVQYALGPLYSIQILESILLLIMCLIKLVIVERNLIFVLATLCYYFCIVLITGAYMMSAGNITFEAAAVSTSMFDSGWELIRAPRRLRTLIVVSMVNAQVPVFMTAFGVLILSYTNILVVLRSSYSFFAVMY